jgi:SAM-dependent methyltransferase
MLSRSTGFADQIEFQYGNAEELPFDDNSFDVTISVTVLEEVAADRAVNEIVRVTRPGGRIGIAVRALDMPGLVSADIPQDLVEKIGRVVPGEASPGGCSDASLYRKLSEAGVGNLQKWPTYCPDGHHLAPVRQRIGARLNEREKEVLRVAADKAGDAYFIAVPMHVAVGERL